jgi:hypothetical protein
MRIVDALYTLWIVHRPSWISRITLRLAVRGRRRAEERAFRARAGLEAELSRHRDPSLPAIPEMLERTPSSRPEPRRLADLNIQYEDTTLFLALHAWDRPQTVKIKDLELKFVVDVANHAKVWISRSGKPLRWARIEFKCRVDGDDGNSAIILPRKRGITGPKGGFYLGWVRMAFPAEAGESRLVLSIGRCRGHT